MLLFVLFLNFYSSSAVFAPTDNDVFKTAVNNCLEETQDGSCPTFAATTVPGTTTTYGVIGDWDVSQVTRLYRSTSTPPLFICCPLVSSLEFSPLTPLLLFLRFSQCSFFWIVSTITRHRHPPAAFEGAYEFNADISKWNTANVNTMYESTSTPLVSVVLSLEFHSPLCFSSSFPQCFGAVASNEHCAAVPGRL